jgi:pimeloyl-ACP methyl ester carboxylesterase
MKEEQISIGGLTVNFKVAGEGPAVLILHGWGGSSDSWMTVQKMLAKSGFTVFCPDLPGFGKSVTPKVPWGVSDYKEWVLSFARSQNLNRFFLVSHSFGGRIAIKLAVSCPDRITALVLCDAAGLKHKPDLKTRIIFFLSKIGNVIFAHHIMSRMKDAARNFFYLFFRHRDYVKAPANMRETMKRVIAEDLTPYIPDIKVKTMVVWGKKDKILPVEDAYFFNETIEGSRLEILGNTDHSPHLQIPERLAGLIMEFFNS